MEKCVLVLPLKYNLYYLVNHLYLCLQKLYGSRVAINSLYPILQQKNEKEDNSPNLLAVDCQFLFSTVDSQNSDKIYCKVSLNFVLSL